MENSNNIMLDIETLGLNMNSIILSIAAVEFNISSGEIGNKFYHKISFSSNQAANRKLDEEVLDFWLDNLEEFRYYLKSETKDLKTVLFNLTKFIPKDYLIWSRSPRFDFGILQTAYEYFNLRLPWSYKNEHCTRTLEYLVKDSLGVQPTNTHNALKDCINQINYCTKAWNLLNSK